MVIQKIIEKKEIISQNPNSKREKYEKLNNFLQKKREENYINEEEEK